MWKRSQLDWQLRLNTIASFQFFVGWCCILQRHITSVFDQQKCHAKNSSSPTLRFPMDDIETLQRYTKMFFFCARFWRLWLWKASFPPVVDKRSTTSTAWNSPFSRTTYTHNWQSKHDGVENASPFKYGCVTMLGIYVKFQGYLTWDKDKRGQFSTTQRSNMQDPSTRPRPPVLNMGDSSTSKSKRSFSIGRLANRLLRLFGNAN